MYDRWRVGVATRGVGYTVSKKSSSLCTLSSFLVPWCPKRLAPPAVALNPSHSLAIRVLLLERGMRGPDSPHFCASAAVRCWCFVVLLSCSKPRLGGVGQEPCPLGQLAH